MYIALKKSTAFFIFLLELVVKTFEIFMIFAFLH